MTYFNSLAPLSTSHSLFSQLLPLLSSESQSSDFLSRSLNGRVAKSDEKETVIEIEVPGVDPSDVTVKIEGRSISVETPGGYTYVALGQRLSYDHATATLKHGLLTIKIPKRDAKVIEVQVTES